MQLLLHSLAWKWDINRQKIHAAKSMIPGVLCSVGCFLATNESSALGRATQALQRLRQSTFSISSEVGQTQGPPQCMSQHIVQNNELTNGRSIYHSRY